MIELITPTIFKHDNKTYTAPKSAIDNYLKRKTLRNLLSRARLLDDSEASSVIAMYGRVLVFLVDGLPVVKIAPKSKPEVEKLERLHKNVLLIFRSKPLNMRVAKAMIDKDLPLQQYPDYFGTLYIHPQFAEL